MPLAAAAAVAVCPSSVGIARPLCGASAHPRRRRRFRLEASSSASTPAPASKGSGCGGWSGAVPRGQSDEMIFESTVRYPSSELYGSMVVLRQLKSSQAKRRGRRALEVLKKLARRQIMYHSYALEVHGYITPGNAVEEEDGPFILVHGVRADLTVVVQSKEDDQQG